MKTEAILKKLSLQLEIEAFKASSQKDSAILYDASNYIDKAIILLKELQS